jgi:hypothetical protein
MGRSRERKRVPRVYAVAERWRIGERERWRSGERGLPFIVRVWSEILIGLGSFNRDGHF